MFWRNVLCVIVTQPLQKKQRVFICIVALHVIVTSAFIVILGRRRKHL